MKNNGIKIYRESFDNLLDSIGDITKYLDGFKDIDYPYYKHSKAIGHVNLSSDEKEYSLEITAPGFTKEELGIELKDNVLTIKGEHSSETKEVEKKYSRREFSKSSFNRSFTIPEDTSGEIDANFENGILYISLKKKELPPKEDAKKIVIR
jgi:HSP20 family protein